MLKPLGDRIVVELAETADETASGIILPGSSKEQPQEGTVIAVGAGRRLDNGQVVQIVVQEGYRILFEKHMGTEVTFQDQPCLILKESDILAIIE